MSSDSTIMVLADNTAAVRHARGEHGLAFWRQSTEVASGLRTTGEIPRLHREEAIGELFCRDTEGHEADLLLDDQALFMETTQGTVVLLGCAHSGVINTLDHIQQLTANKPIHAVMGGMHMGSATESRMEWTLRELHRFRISLLVPMHCTGQKATAALWAAFPHACQAGGVGTVFHQEVPFQDSDT